MRHLRSGLALAGLLVVCACADDGLDVDLKGASKLSPSMVSDAEGWKLFDRSISSAYQPTKNPLTVSFDEPALISALKIHGPAPYRLTLRGASGADLGSGALDLSRLPSGWTTVIPKVTTRTDKVQLSFEPTSTSSDGVPELELWTSEGAPDAGTRDVLAPKLPPGDVAFPTISDTHELAAGECADFSIPIERSPAVFSRAFLAYRATGTLRSFSLEASINGLPSAGGAWLAADASPHSFADEIDPGTLNLGPNTVKICVPAGAGGHVTLSDVRVIGELDRGSQLISDVRVGEVSHGSGGEPFATNPDDEMQLELTRLVAPDAIRIAGPLRANTKDVECLDHHGKRTPIAFHDQEDVILLEGTQSACAALAVTFEGATSITRLEVLGSGAAERVDWPRFVITSAAEHFGGVAWIGGFTMRPKTDGAAISVQIQNGPATASAGAFGSLVHRDAHATGAWDVDVVAQYADGSRETKTVHLTRDASSDLAAATGAPAPASTHDDEVHYGAPGKDLVVKATSSRLTQVHLGSLVGVDVVAGAVTKPTDITVRHLETTALPPLDPGMINVTAPRGHGYELLPHGQRFAKPIDAFVPFDPTLIPSTRTADDVHTYFYDPAAKHWKQLTRTGLDIKDHVVHNATDHFTIMIDAVLAVPTNPTPLSFDPTSLSSIPAASPAAGIDLISAPTANSMGDARLSLPIRSPAGRGAYSPNLGFSYSSAAGNDWLGVGWSVSMSRIEIDSRWGVPTYADGEEVRYLLDGGQLVPTLDSDGPACSDGSTARRYHTRAEGAFAHILRCGNNPSNFHWELIDRNGTTFVYGDTASSAGNASVKSTKARPAACGSSCPGIYRWYLRTVTDTHSNTTTYSYFVDDIAGAEPGREVYPQSISYTSHPSLAAAYSIEFALDSSNRPDQIISGRGGFKEQTRRLLRWVRVKYGTQIIRQYVLTYSHGMFDKSVLTSFRMYGEGGCAATANSFTLPTCGGLVDEHTFSYVNNTQMMGFSAPQTWTVAGAHPADPAINAGDDRTSSGRLSLGFPIPEVSALGSFGVTGTWGDRTETTGMFDLNGDGLADELIYDEHNVPVPELNGGEIGTTGSGLFGVAAQSPTKPMPALGFEHHSSWGVDARVGFQSDGFGASASYTDATSRAEEAVLDVDGDGYIDYVDAYAAAGSAVELSSPGSDGQQFTPNPFGVLSTVHPEDDPLLGGMNQHIKDRAIPADPVVQWVAPFTGTIDLAATAQLFGPGSSDGVTVLVYQNETLLGSWPLASIQDPPFDFEMSPLSVTAGDSIFMVVKTGGDDGNSSTVLKDKVEAYMTPEYLTACANALCLDPSPLSSEPGALDPMNAPVTAFDSENDFRAVATRPTILSATGKLEVHGSFNKVKSAADLRFCLERFSKDAVTTDVPCASVPTADIVWPLSGHSVSVAQAQIFTHGQAIDRIGFPVNAGDRLVLRAESDYSVDPATFTFVPDAGGHTLVYSQACETGDSDPDCNQTTDPDLLASVKPEADMFGLAYAPVSPPQPFGAVPLTHKRLFWEPYTVTPFNNPLGEGNPISIVLRSNRDGTTAPQTCIFSPCTFSMPYGDGGDWISFEIAGTGTFPVHPMYIEVHGAGTPEYVPVTFRKAQPDRMPTTPFVGGYRNLFVSFWNERDTAFTPTELLDVYNIDHVSHPDDQQAALDAFCAAQPACQCDSSSRDDCEWSYLARAALTPVADFNGTPLAGSMPAYVVEGGDAFVNSGAMNASFIGGGQFGGGQILGGGLFEPKYLRLSGTTSKFIGLDVGLRSVPGLPGGLSGSVGESDTNTTTDLVDMNGDGVLDMVAGNRTFAGHISPTAGPQLTGFAFGDGFRRRTGYDYSISLSGNAASPLTTAGGRALLMLTPPESPSSVQYDTSAGLSMSRSQETQDLIDINGDGLPDVVSRSGTSITVRYNLGNQLGAPEVFGTLDSTMAGPIDGFQSVEGATDLDSTSNALSHETTLTQESTTTLDLFFAKFTKTTDTASNRTVRQLVDLNGDGLPDLVMKKKGSAIVVEYNRGGSFGAHKTWATPAWTAGLLPAATSGFASQFASMLSGTQAVADVDVLAGSTRSLSSSRAAAVNVPLGTSGLSLGLSYTYHRSFDAYELALVDINGDGAPDHVLRKAGDPDLHVKINQNRGQANLLTTVHRPLGGTITLTYDSAGNTTSMPHRRQVLTHVDVDDGVDMGASYASPTLATSFNYAGGVYSRNEKQFLGFTTVTTTLADNGGSIVQVFDTSDVRHAGNLLTEIRQDASDNVLSTHSLTYETRPVKDSNNVDVPADPACASALPDLLQREPSNDACTPLFVVAKVDSTTRYEGGVGKTRTVADSDIDQFGNVLTSTDSGDDQISSDDTKTTAKYKNDVNATSWLLGRPTQVILMDGTGTKVLREREGGYNASYTELKAISVETGSSTAETDLGYDAYGNVNSITTPKNLDGQQQSYAITFDAAVQTYPVEIVNGFGEMSTATYDVRYGVATLETDVSGNSLVRTLDTYGRLASVTGPYDSSGPGISMEYHPETSPPSAITVTHPSAPADYTGTLPSPITTVTFVDGLARPIELRKTSNVGGVAGMTTSGLVGRDLLGRVSAAYQPSFAPGPGTAFVIPAATYATVNSYDALGRTVLTTLPDSHTITMTFDTGKYTTTAPVLFRTTVTDPNGHHRETYADVAGRTRAFAEHPTATTTSITTYDYTPAGDLSKLVDAEGNTTSLEYDLRGLRTTLHGDDTGSVTDVYDDMGNRIKHIDATHAAHGSVVYYDYDRDRLILIKYPSKPQVAYKYEGARLSEVIDETGAQSFEYGALGERRRVLRTIKRLDGTTVTFDTHFTTDSLGRQLQVVYPDGTTISNTYDDGGALAQVSGSGSGWSKVYADEIQYDVFGNRTHMRFGNNVETSWTYEPQRVRLSTVTTTLPSGPNVQQLVYGYDAASNPVTINNNVPALTASSGTRPGPSTLTLTYDDVDQLETVRGSGWVDVSNDTTYDEGFSYTASHNIGKKERTHEIASLPQSATSFDSTYKYASGHPHLPSSISSATGTLKIIYDPSGNPIERDNSTTGLHQTLTWDDDNRLSTITASTYVQRNTYDAFGIRALRDEDGDQTLFANQYFDLAGTNGGAEYVFAGDMRVATVLGSFTSGENPTPPTTAGTPYYLHPDSLGSTAVVTTDAGDAQESHDYFIDGEAWVDHTSATPVNGYLFEGKPYDKLTGFYDYGQRFYDPRTSLWLGEDSAFTGSPGKAIGRPMMLAVSAFAEQNPATFIDPDGRDSGWAQFIHASPKDDVPNRSVPAYVQQVQHTTAPYMAVADVTQATYEAGKVGAGIALDMTPGVGTVRAFSRGDYIGGTLSLVGDLSLGLGMVAKVGKLARVATAVRDAEVVEHEAIAVRSAETEANQVAGTIRKVNPTKGKMNCVGCAIATDATLAGNPASALSGGPWNVPEVMARYFPGVPGIPANGEKGLRTLMQHAGPGARAIVWGTRDGDEIGHVFNAVNQGGTIRFLDGQTGRTAKLTGFNGFYWYRTN